MTEDEWRASTALRPMLTAVGDGASDRKLRLFACAGCLTLGHALPDEAVALLDVCERYADGRAGAASSAAGRAAKAPRATAKGGRPCETQAPTWPSGRPCWRRG